MKSTFLLTVLFTAVVELASCTSSDNKPEVSVDLDNYCSQVADVACYNIWNCCTGKQIEDTLGITISVEPDECHRDVELICQDNMATILWAAHKGSVQLVQQNADACLASTLLAGDCFQHVSDVPWQRFCSDGYWVGTLSVGSECLYNFECQDGSYCAVDRKCRALPKEGQDCDAGICQPGLFCNPSDGERKCRPRRSAGLPCEADDWCADGLYCGFDDMGQGTCYALKALGVECKDSRECQSTFCVPGVCEDGSQCFEDSDCLGKCSSDGETCWDDLSCSGYCTQSHNYCNSDWDCAENEPCVKQTCERTCIGQTVCAKRWTVIDYCTDTTGMLLNSSN